MSFFRSDENPNDVCGGGGCLCHPMRSDETRGPFYIFPATSTDSGLNPHAVLCEHCACEIIDQKNGAPADELDESYVLDIDPVEESDVTDEPVDDFIRELKI